MIASDLKTTKIADTIEEVENKKNADDIDRGTKEKLEIGSSSELDKNNSINETISEKNAVNNSAKDRKSKIMEHLRQSSNNFQYTSGDYRQRNQKIKEHLQKSLT